MCGEILTEMETVPSVQPGLLNYLVKPDGSLVDLLPTGPHVGHEPGEQSGPFIIRHSVPARRRRFH